MPSVRCRCCYVYATLLHCCDPIIEVLSGLFVFSFFFLIQQRLLKEMTQAQLPVCREMLPPWVKNLADALALSMPVAGLRRPPKPL